MKEFKKWWKTEYDEPRYIDNPTRYSASKAGWKAALKWVKNNSECAKSLFMISCDEIEDELKDE